MIDWIFNDIIIPGFVLVFFLLLFVEQMNGERRASNDRLCNKEQQHNFGFFPSSLVCPPNVSSIAVSIDRSTAHLPRRSSIVASFSEWVSEWDTHTPSKNWIVASVLVLKRFDRISAHSYFSHLTARSSPPAQGRPSHMRSRNVMIYYCRSIILNFVKMHLLLSFTTRKVTELLAEDNNKCFSYLLCGWLDLRYFWNYFSSVDYLFSCCCCCFTLSMQTITHGVVLSFPSILETMQEVRHIVPLRPQ